MFEVYTGETRTKRGIFIPRARDKCTMATFSEYYIQNFYC